MSSKHETMRVLVVDDLPDNLSLLDTVLSLEGYEVDVAQDGYTAIEKVEADPPDLILLDVMMPGLNGCEVACHFQKDGRFKHIPIWLVTGCYDIPCLDDNTDNIEGILQKPLEFDDLLTKIRASLASQKNCFEPTMAKCS